MLFRSAARIRELNGLGFAVEEMSLDVAGGEAMRVSLAIASRRFHAEQLLRLTGVDALEGQAQLLLNDLHEYGVWIQVQEGERFASGLVAARWRAEVLEPTLSRLRPHLATGRDPLQAYCDALDQGLLLPSELRIIRIVALAGGSAGTQETHPLTRDANGWFADLPDVEIKHRVDPRTLPEGPAMLKAAREYHRCPLFLHIAAGAIRPGQAELAVRLDCDGARVRGRVAR